MNYRLSSVLAEESITSPGTKVIDLDMADIISRIQINVEVESSGAVHTDHIASVISNIELIDGSDVLFSLSGKECQALDYYQTKKMPLNALTDRDGNDAVMVFNLNFGRYLYDAKLALDPAKFRNPQLKITHNYQAFDAAADTARMEIRAFLFDERVPTPDGFLMAKEHYQFATGVADTFEYIDMPVDHVTRRYMVIGTAKGYFCQQVVNALRLSEDNSKRVPYDTDVWQLLKALHQTYPRIEEYGHFGLLAATRAIYASPTQDIVINAVGAAVTQIVSVSTIPTKMPITTDITADGEANAVISGYDPHYSFILPFGRADDPEDWYDVTKIGNLKLRLKAGSAGASNTVEVVTEQLRKY